MEGMYKVSSTANLIDPGMQQTIQQRRTTTDVVFNELWEQISSLQLLPGTRISEVEVAKKFGISRQPVRDAFNRLHNLDLLLIRPQKATVVRGFSLERIEQARFVRLSVELEVVKRACKVWNKTAASALQQNLKQQQKSVTAGTTEVFHKLDFEFHSLICEHSDCAYATETLAESRQKTDRLCILSFGKEDEAATLLDDHQQLAAALEAGSVERAQEVVRLHLSRLDATIAAVHDSHAEYFE
jgi:DNA-binding GntR family transcriptional regulator